MQDAEFDNQQTDDELTNDEKITIPRSTDLQDSDDLKNLQQILDDNFSDYEDSSYSDSSESETEELDDNTVSISLIHLLEIQQMPAFRNCTQTSL